MKIGTDVAASEFYKEGKYDLDFKNSDSDPATWKTGPELMGLYKEWCAKYPMISIEDTLRWRGRHSRGGDGRSCPGVPLCWS